MYFTVLDVVAALTAGAMIGTLLAYAIAGPINRCNHVDLEGDELL